MLYNITKTKHGMLCLCYVILFYVMFMLCLCYNMLRYICYITGNVMLLYITLHVI